MLYDNKTGSMVFHGTLCFALHVAAGGILALIIQLFAAAYTELELDAGAFEIKRERYEGVALLFDDTEQAVDLPLMKQELAHTHRVAVENIALFIRADMHSVDEHFAVHDRTPGILQVDTAAAQRFHLGAHKLNAGFERFLDKIIVVGFFVLSNGFGGCVFRKRSPRFL